MIPDIKISCKLRCDDELQYGKAKSAYNDDENLSYIDSLFFDSLPSPSDSKKKVANDNYNEEPLPVDLGVEEDAGAVDRAYFRKEEKNSSTIPVNEASNETVADCITGIREQLSINQFTGRTLNFKTSKKKSSMSRYDSLGFRIPDDDAIKFDLLTEDEAASVLWRCVISIQDNLLVLNKPPGLSSQDGGRTRFSVASLLPRLAFRLRFNKHDAFDNLKIVHRLDKEATGALVISRNHDSNQRLSEAFANRWIKKSYLCITAGIPEESEGDIHLPMLEKSINGNYRMVGKRPNELGEVGSSDKNPHRSTTTNAFTKYKMLDRRNDAALLECTAFTGIKHQIRVHLSTGLETPILGDHKYSHNAFMAPQRLPKRMLDAMDMRQSKVRYLGLHLHAHKIQFGGKEMCSDRKSTDPPPGFFNFIERKSFKEGRKINAPIPSFFLENAQRLGLKLPSVLRWSICKIF